MISPALNEHELPYLIIGASGHAKVVASLILAQQKNLAGFIDQNSSEQLICGLPIIGDDSYLKNHPHRSVNLALGIGDNYLRQKLYLALEQAQFFPAIIHPRAHIEMSVTMDKGSIICNQAIIGIETQLGRGVIINTGAIVDHECEIDDFSHISVGARLAGRVRVGKNTLIGIGATVIDQVTIGRNSIIGAGSVVVSDIPDGVVAVGVPARIIKEVSESRA